LTRRIIAGRPHYARRFSDARRLVAGAAVIALVAAVEAAFGVARSDTEPPGPLEPGNAGAPAELRQCGDCHMVFPARMLPIRSWTAILSTMDDHFGEDAAIPKKDLDIIRDYLTSHAADAPGATAREKRTPAGQHAFEDYRHALVEPDARGLQL
jgi:hypothetical protein